MASMVEINLEDAEDLSGYLMERFSNYPNINLLAHLLTEESEILIKVIDND